MHTILQLHGRMCRYQYCTVCCPMKFIMHMAWTHCKTQRFRFRCSDTFSDNQSLVLPTQRPESTPKKKKEKDINFHYIGEDEAMVIGRATKEKTESKLADILTKCIGRVNPRKSLRKFLHCADGTDH